MRSMKHRASTKESISVAMALILLLAAPMLSAPLTLVLAVGGLVVLTLISRTHFRERGALSAIIGFGVAILILLAIYSLHQWGLK